MIILSLCFLLVVHYFSGRGLMELFKITAAPQMYSALAFITGVVISSLVPFALELARIPLTLLSVTAGMVIVCLLLNITAFKQLVGFSFLRLVKSFKFGFKPYEWPFMILFAVMLFSSVWRAWYYPPNARDMLSGPEAIAEYAVKEHTMINSVLTVNLETTNNHLKPPFVTGLQIIYKLFGFTSGQLWLSVIAIAFLVFLYHALKQKVHGIIACTLLLLIISIPELYGYTFVMLYDYSNMVLLFLGFYFLQQYFTSQNVRQFYFAALLFGFATYIRLETLILISLIIPALWYNAYKHKVALKHIISRSAVLMAIPTFFYVIWMNVYLAYYMPEGFSVTSEVNSVLSDLSPFFVRLYDIVTRLMFSELGFHIYGYFFYIFIILLAAELVILRKLSSESRNWLYGVLVIYIGLGIVGYLLPLADLANTTKRGLFKFFPIMLMAMAGNGLVQQLSNAISKAENTPPSNVAAAPVRAAVTKQKGKTNRNKR